MPNFKKILIITITTLFFFSCKKEKDVDRWSNNKEIDTLLLKSNNVKYNETERLQYADEAFEKINKLGTDSIEVDFYHKLALSYFDVKNYKKSNKAFLKMAEKAFQINDIEAIADSNYGIGYYYYGKYDYDSAYYYYSKSEKAYKQLKSYRYYAQVIGCKSNILWCKKDYAGSEAMTIKALKISQNNQDNLMVYNCFLTLGNNLLGMNNPEKALYYYNNAAQKTKDLKSEDQFGVLKAQPYNYISNIYILKKEYRKANQFANKALQFGNFKKNSPALYCSVINNIAYSKFKLGDKSSLNQFLEAQKIGDSIENASIQITCNIYLSEYYLGQKDTANAMSNIIAAKQNAHKNKFFEDELKSLEVLAKIDTKNGLNYNNRYIQLSDSLQNNERKTRDKFARIEYETDQISIEKKEIKTENDRLLFQQSLIAGISLVTLLFGISLWYNKNQKTKFRELQFTQEKQNADSEIYQLMIESQQKIEEGKQLEKQRISLELHDGVMGRLTGVRLNLYELKNNLDPQTIAKCLEQIPEIQSIEKEVRNIAHDLNSNLFADNIGFVSVVKSLCNENENLSQTKFAINIDDRIDWLTVNNEIKINIYRVLQEALQNIHKYAQANNVAVSIVKNEIGIAMEINDDGVGFDSKSNKSGIGLQNMKYRIEKLKGEIIILSEPKKGTKINLIIPI